MKLYEIDRDYMDYLHKIDSKVLTHNVDKHQRKFIAIKVKLNGYQYFVPLSSPLILEIIIVKMVSRKYSLQEFLLLREFLMEILQLNLI